MQDLGPISTSEYIHESGYKCEAEDKFMPKIELGEIDSQNRRLICQKTVHSLIQGNFFSI